MGLNKSGSEVVLQPSLSPLLPLAVGALMLPLSLLLQSATQKVLNVTHRGMHTCTHTHTHTKITVTLGKATHTLFKEVIFSQAEQL